jgi:PAS domain S-box-containing protein
MKNPFSRYSEMGIRKRVFLPLIVVFVPLLLLEAFIYFQWFRVHKETEVQANLELARAVAKNFEAFLQGLIRNELAVGLALTASQPMTERDRDRLLDTFKARNPEFRSIFWMNPDGAVIASSLRSYIGFDLSDRSFFQKVKHGQEWAVSELIVGRATGKPAFTVSCGIRNEKGALLGVVAASIEPDRMESVLGIPRSGDAGVSLIDNKGMHVFRYPPSTYTWEQRNWLKLYPILGEALKGKEIVNASHVSKIRSGTKRIVAFTPIPSIGWIASCSRAEPEVIAEITGTMLPQALLVLLVTLAAFGAAVSLSRPITGSILKLRNHFAAIGRGETENLAPISGPEELKDLAVAFNQMAGDVRSREASLRQSEQRWATTLASIGDAVIATDVDAKITFMNSVAEGLTGWTLREASQKPVPEVFNIINEQTRKAVDNPVTRVLREGNVIGLANHTVLFRKDGTQVAIDDSGAPIRDDTGNILGVILVFRDITERKQAEEELRKSRDELELRVKERTVELKNANINLKRANRRLETLNKELQDFAFVASHDLQEPLRKIRSFGDMLAARPAISLDKASTDYVKRMQSAASRMQTLLNSLLSYSRVTTKAEPRTNTDLKNSVDAALSNLEIMIKEKNACIEAGDLPTVKADPVQMIQLFQNLIANALKYHRDGEAPHVKIYSREAGDEKEVYEIFVEDNGIGFEEKYLDRIFLPFQRLHGRSSGYEGVGMGLAICKKIVERHGGEITARSAPGKGSTFIVTLPAEGKVG